MEVIDRPQLIPSEKQKFPVTHEEVGTDRRRGGEVGRGVWLVGLEGTQRKDKV